MTLKFLDIGEKVLRYLCQAINTTTHASCIAAGMGRMISCICLFVCLHGCTVASDVCWYCRVLMLLAWVCISIRLPMFSGFGVCSTRYKLLVVPCMTSFSIRCSKDIDLCYVFKMNTMNGCMIIYQSKARCWSSVHIQSSIPTTIRSQEWMFLEWRLLLTGFNLQKYSILCCNN